MSLTLDNCCCCVELRFGCLIFGYLHLMKDIVQIFVSTIILAVHTFGRYYYVEIIGLSATFLTTGIITLIFTILLLNGLHQYKQSFVKAYLIYSGISTVIQSIIVLILIIDSEVLVLIVPGLFCLALYTYFLLVVRSYYLKMENTEKSAIFNTPAGTAGPVII